MKHKQNGFTLIEMVVTAALLAAAIASTAPIISRNRWQGDVNRYALELETGLMSLKAKLGQQKTSCSITFPETYSFRRPEQLVEFSGINNSNPTSMQCCNSEISKLNQDPNCDAGYSGHKISDLTGRAQDNLRLVQHELTQASKAIRVAVNRDAFGFTPPGTTANSDQITFLICHERALSENNQSTCVPEQQKLNIACVEIDGTGGVTKGTWELANTTDPISNGRCKKV